MTQDNAHTRAERRPTFPVVGIGASAGGLEALRKLFTAAPPDSGAAWVIVQHLDPTHDSLMAELLAKYTRMPVVQVEDNMPAAPDRVHVIPPNASLTISRGVLRLAEPKERRGLRMPIDLFLSSLAEDQQQAAIAVILSGTGTDGSYGIRAVKAHDGLVLVQAPSSAHYDGMPRSAIATGEADYVLGPEAMPDVILHYCRLVASPVLEAAMEKSDHDYLADITALVAGREGYDFGCYKRGTLERRILRRMGLRHTDRLRDYHQLLRRDNEEVKALARDLLIGVTCFFREPEAWEFLRHEVLPGLLQRHRGGDRVRVWVPGCATGEEAYGLAMLLEETREALNLHVPIMVFATDIARDALDIARSGRYPASIEAHVSHARLEHFFDKEGDSYVVKPMLRERVLFAAHNLVSDPPFSSLDLISCRNVLIYIRGAYQARILSWFHFALAESGFLMLGSSETTGSNASLFRPVAKQWRIYRRLDGAQRRDPELSFAVPGRAAGRLSPSPAQGGSDRGPGQITRRLLLNLFAPAAVLVDENHYIHYFHGRVSDYLGPTTGEPSRHLLALADEQLRLKLRSALQRAAHTGSPVEVSGARVRRGKDWQPVRFAVHPAEQDGLPGKMLLVSFEDEPLRPEPAVHTDPAARLADADALRELEAELAATRQELGETIEQMETSSEELKASNEEVMSMNEELQSSNEELETSKEELQSLNEELIALNSQLEEKLNELQRTTTDLQNLLASTNIATIFIDRAFCIQRFTPAATALLNLMPSDIGRSLTDIAWHFSDPQLLAQAGEILGGKGPFEREIQAESGRWYRRALTAYKTAKGLIDGVVITFMDITERREAEQRLRQSERHLKRITDAVPGLISYVDASRRYRFNNAAYETWLGKKTSELAGQHVRDVLGPDAYRQVEPYIEAALKGEPVSFEYELADSHGEVRALLVNYVPDIDAESGAVNGFFALITDVSDRRAHQREIQSLNERLRRQVEEQEALFRAAPVGLFVARDPGCSSMIMNPAGADLLRIDEHANPSLTGPEAEHLPFRFYQGDRQLKGAELPIQKAAEAGRTVSNEEIEVRFDDGERKILSVHAAPLYEDDKVRGCVGVLIDSTDYRHAIDALAEADRRKDRFLAQLAHELRNPLTPLVAAADLLERHGATPELIERVREALVNQTRHLWRLVDDLLDAARVVHDRLELRRKTLDLRTALHDAVATIEADARKRGHRLHVELPDYALPVSGDPTRLTQVFANLLKNAVNYTPAPGSISLRARRDGERIIAEVEDTGSGLSAQDIEHIFEPMVRSTDLGGGPGLGLGLALARRLVEMHGGHIEVYSDGRGKGSRFTVALPATSPIQATAPAAAAPQAHAGEGRLRVLIVDDQKDVADAVALLLEMKGHKTSSVAHPDEVVSAVRRFRPDVVLLDIGLPERSGIEVAAELARLDERAGMRVIALSGYAEDAAAPGIQELFDGRLLKPVTADQLTKIFADLTG